MEPVLLGDLKKNYLVNSNDDYARAFRDLYKEHGHDIIELFENSANEQKENNK